MRSLGQFQIFYYFFFKKDYTHTYQRNVGCENCKQSPRILRFASMCVLTIGECEGSCIKLRSLHLRGKKVTYSLIWVFVLLLGCVFMFLVLLVRAKAFHKKKMKKNDKFKNVLITSFTLLLTCPYISICCTGVGQD